MDRCFIFSAGSFFGLREHPVKGDLLIAADAGYRLCRQLGLAADLVVGDYDSMPEPEEAVSHIRVPVEKDDTDTMLAIRIGLERGYKQFYFYGATGGPRLDHTLANLQSLAFLAEHGASGILYDHNFAYTAVKNASLTLQRTVDWGILSVFALENVSGVSISGVQYPLENAELSPAFPLGVSNHFTADTARITVENGTVLVGWELPPLP